MRSTAKYISGSSSNQTTHKRTLNERDMKEAKSENSQPSKIHCLEDTSSSGGQMPLQESSNKKRILRGTGERHRVPLSAINEKCNSSLGLSATKLILQGVMKIFKKQPPTPELPKPQLPLAVTKHTRPGYCTYHSVYTKHLNSIYTVTLYTYCMQYSYTLNYCL